MSIKFSKPENGWEIGLDWEEDEIKCRPTGEKSIREAFMS